jgi:hypothetical protein
MGPPENSDTNLAVEVQAVAKVALWGSYPLSQASTPLSARLKLSTSNYIQWCSMFTDAMEKCALGDHLL